MNKQELLGAIRQLAKENGGQAPGKILFEQRTGIKESHWSGRYWTKWSEAILEAGLEPNKLNSAFSDDYLLGKYATLIERLGHIPTSAELKLISRNDTDFPSPNTFSRFGKKKQLLGSLLEFCEGNPEFQHLTTLIEKEPHSKPRDKAEEAPASNDDKSGYVYLMQFGKEYKIGSSLNVERRFRELKTQMPYEGRIIHTISTGDPEGIEAYWHQYFADKRLKGEWFALTTSDVKYFRRRKLM